MKNNRNKTEEVKVVLEPEQGFFVLVAKVKDNAVMEMQFVVLGDEILINDISSPGWRPMWAPHRHVNKGYGSKLMEALFDYAKEHNIHRISGYLSFNDILHKERLHAFYTKHGFDIVEYDEVNDDNYYGRVEKILFVDICS